MPYEKRLWVVFFFLQSSFHWLSRPYFVSLQCSQNASKPAHLTWEQDWHNHHQDTRERLQAPPRPLLDIILSLNSSGFIRMTKLDPCISE